MSDGGVYRKDAEEIRDFLRKESENGNRFVSFEAGKQGLTRGDFAVFKTSFEALEHAYEHSTDYDQYTVKSITAIEKALDRLIDLDKEIDRLLSVERGLDRLPGIGKDQRQTFEWSSEQQLKETFIKVLSDKMAKADWYFEQNRDDILRWYKGRDEMMNITDDLKALSRLDGGLEDAKKLWNQYAPDTGVPAPGHFSNPELLNSISGGLIINDDGPAVQKLLQEQQEKGNRYVAFGRDPSIPPHDRFNGFRTRLDAELFAEVMDRVNRLYHVRSVAHLQQEIKNVLEPDKGRFLQEIDTRLRLNQYELNNQRSLDERQMNMNTPVRQMTVQELRDSFVKHLSEKMSKADWYYAYSDDSKVWNRGHDQVEQIKEELRLLSILDNSSDQAQKLWKQYVPSYSVQEPAFFSNPAELSGVLGGYILKKDIANVQEVLGTMQSNGSRFVVFESDPLTTAKERFTGFTTAIEAHHFANENVSTGKNCILSSIADLKEDLQRVSEPGMDKKFALVRMMEILPGADKLHRSTELSR
ncbi:MAG: hypothetical protein QM594_09655 [Niabella sp.]